jgi:hypothetical protein
MKHFGALLTVLGLATFATPAKADRFNPARERLSSPDEFDANNSLFVEGGGPGLLYSVNYERLVETDCGLRIGFSYTSLSASASSGGSTSNASAAILAVPVIASYLGLRGGNHILELGVGGTAIYATGAASGGGIAASGSGMSALGTALIGYRRQPPDGGFQFRVGVEALVGKGIALSNPDPDKLGVVPWMYMSLGFSL